MLRSQVRFVDAGVTTVAVILAGLSLADMPACWPAMPTHTHDSHWFPLALLHRCGFFSVATCRSSDSCGERRQKSLCGLDATRLVARFDIVDASFNRENASSTSNAER
jgi:hypothetical protein